MLALPCLGLVVCLLLQPASWIPTQVETTHLIIDKDREHEWQAWQPPYKPVKEEAIPSASLSIFMWQIFCTNLTTALTSKGTSSDPYPCQGSMIRKQPELSQTQDRSSEPSSCKIPNSINVTQQNMWILWKAKGLAGYTELWLDITTKLCPCNLIAILVNAAIAI